MRLITFIIMLLLTNFALSQSDSTQSEVFETPEISPEFPGGTTKLYEYLENTRIIPLINGDSPIQGRVYIQFDIDEFGMVQNVNVAKGVHPTFDEECFRIVCIMPDWIPGESNGECESVRYTLPFKVYNY